MRAYSFVKIYVNIYVRNYIQYSLKFQYSLKLTVRCLRIRKTYGRQKWRIIYFRSYILIYKYKIKRIMILLKD